uniref:DIGALACTOSYL DIACYLGLYCEROL DEFICIENT 1 family protein n=1 Tax=Rhizophora mucronata TaxID=61149 RepID=A0A2P2K4D3_RHIMU
MVSAGLINSTMSLVSSTQITLNTSRGRGMGLFKLSL